MSMTHAEAVQDTQRRRSGQASRAGTPALVMLCGRVAARPAELLLVTHLLLGHVQVFGSEVDGWMTLRELHPTMHLQHAADRRPGQELGKTAGPETFRQVFSYPSHLRGATV